MCEVAKTATLAAHYSHSVDCKAERVRPGKYGNDTPIVSSASWRRSKTVTRNGRRASPRRRGTSRLTARTSGVRCCALKTNPVCPNSVSMLRGSHKPQYSTCYYTGEPQRLTQPLVRKVLGTDLLRPATAMPLPPGIAKSQCFSFFLASTEMAGWSSSWKARTCRLMYSNWASRSAWSWPSLVFRLAWLCPCMSRAATV